MLKKALALLGLTITLSFAQEETRILTQFERDYILLKRGQYEVEENFSYVYMSVNQVFLQGFAILDPVFLTLGRFGIERVRRHIFTNVFSLRYGVRDHIQVEMAVPVIYRYEEGTVPETGVDRSADKFGLGDIAFGLSYQPLRETHRRPALILTAALKTRTGKGPFDIDPNRDVPTGTGFYSVRGGISLLKGLDPVVVFGGIAYAYNIEQKVNKLITPQVVQGQPAFVEKFDPGDTISLNAGFAYALSYKFSLSLQYIQNYTLHTYIWVRNEGRRRVLNSQINVAMLKVGTSWNITRSTSFNVGLSVGLTGDTPDYIIEVRIPYRF
ncbi:MAG: transporter [Aquificota bacterium]|nr:transporter [Aquificota bacterium]